MKTPSDIIHHSSREATKKQHTETAKSSFEENEILCGG